MLSVVATATSVKAQDLSAEVKQTAFDKVIQSMPIPFTLFEHTDPFKKAGEMNENIIFDDSVFTKQYTSEESHNLYKWAFNPDIKKNEGEEIFRTALQVEWERVREQLQAYIDEYERQPSTKSDNAVDKTDFSYDELTIEDMKKIQGASLEDALKMFSAEEKGAFGIKGHLSYFRVDLNERPTLKVTGPKFDINNIRIETTVTGELWTKLPEFRCCRRFMGVCICVRVDWVWKRIASLTVSPDIGADATVTFTPNNLKVVASGRFRKLFLDYAILRDLNLAGIANRLMASKSFEVYDASAFVASLPYINSKFRIESIAIPVNPSGVTINVNIKQ